MAREGQAGHSVVYVYSDLVNYERCNRCCLAGFASLLVYLWLYYLYSVAVGGRLYRWDGWRV